MSPRRSLGQASTYALTLVLLLGAVPAFGALGTATRGSIYGPSHGETVHALPELRSAAQAGLVSRATQLTQRARTWLSGNPRVAAAVPTRTVDVVDEIHGVRVADPYRWLEDPGAPEVHAWLDANDTRTRDALRDLPGDRGIKKRLALEFEVNDVGRPTRYGDIEIQSELVRGLDKRVYYVADAGGENRRLLFDPNTWSDDGTTNLEGYDVSKQGSYAAYRISENGMDDSILRIRKLDDGTDLDETLTGLRSGGVSWLPEETGFLYHWLPESGTVSDELRPGHRSLRLHQVGQTQADDATAFPAALDPQRFLGGGLSDDGRWLHLSYGGGWSANDHYLFDMQAGDLLLGDEPIVKRGGDAADWVRDEALSRGFVPFAHELDAIVHYVWNDGYFYIYTDWDAPRGRLFRTTPDKLAVKDWVEIVPHSDRTLEDFDVVDGRLVVSYLEDVTTRIEVRELDGTFIREQELPGLGTATVSSNKGEPGAVLRYTSYDQPTTYYEWDVANGKLIEYKRDRTYFDVENMTVSREWATSKDGTRVPMFVLHRKDVKLDGSNPTWLHGYGGFSSNVEPYFRRDAAQWVEAGGVFVDAVLRGGAEFGESWHQAGKGANKQNVFDDAAAIAQHLIDRGYTKPEHMAIEGGSNGGLLVGAMITQYPELFCAGVCGVPLLDMVRYHLSGAGRTWVDEYGSAENAAEFRTLLDYSPYHNIDESDDLPALLMLTADSDDRVAPNHARKFAARYQAANPDNSVLLRVNRNAGHGGGATMASYYESVSDKLRYMGWKLGDRRFQHRLTRSNWAQRRARAKVTIENVLEPVTRR